MAWAALTTHNRIKGAYLDVFDTCAMRHQQVCTSMVSFWADTNLSGSVRCITIDRMSSAPLRRNCSSQHTRFVVSTTRLVRLNAVVMPYGCMRIKPIPGRALMKRWCRKALPRAHKHRELLVLSARFQWRKAMTVSQRENVAK